MECIICYNECFELRKCNECVSDICCSQCFDNLTTSNCPKCRNSKFKTFNYSEGLFDFINDEISRKTLNNTYKAITNTNNWENLKNFSVDLKKGFMFSSEDFLKEISDETERLNTGHSGASWGFCMRQMHEIAKNGWNNYKQMNNYNT